MPRGVLISVSHILLVNGTKVKTFYDCDEDYLEDKEVSVGDVVSFEYVGATNERHAAEIERVTPTAKERELQANTKTKTKAAPEALGIDELEAALLDSGAIGDASEEGLARAKSAVKDPGADWAAFEFLSALDPDSRPRFVFCEDYDVGLDEVAALERAFRGAVTLGAERVGNELRVLFSIKGSEHIAKTFGDSFLFLEWLQGLLEQHDTVDRVWFLPCHVGSALLVLNAADCQTLRDAGVPIESGWIK